MSRLSIALKGKSYLLVLMSMLWTPNPANAAGSVLMLHEAERIAIERDSLKSRHLELTRSLQSQSRAERYLPNPKIKMGFDNFPVDTFDRAQAPMTQVKIGISQTIPRGRSRRIRSAYKQTLSRRERELARNRVRLARREVRKSWLELYYWQRAEKIVRANRRLFRQMLQVTEDQYRAGRGLQHEVIRAQLEIDLLDDRLTKIKNRQDRARAALGKWIGIENAARPLAGRLPASMRFGGLHSLLERLPAHPLLRSDGIRVDAGRKLVELARQEYKPKFSFYASYGQRKDRPDFASVGIMMDIPFFKRKRNRQKVIASERKVSAAMFARNERYRTLRRQLVDAYTTWQRLNARYRRYIRTLLPKARMNSVTTMSSYQNKRSEFATLVKARITELDIKLRALRLRIDIRKTESDLSYLTGEQS